MLNQIKKIGQKYPHATFNYNLLVRTSLMNFSQLKIVENIIKHTYYQIPRNLQLTKSCYFEMSCHNLLQIGHLMGNLVK